MSSRRLIDSPYYLHSNPQTTPWHFVLAEGLPVLITLSALGFVDPGGDHVHLLRNESGVEAPTVAVQLLPADAVRRIDADRPQNSERSPPHQKKRAAAFSLIWPGFLHFDLQAGPLHTEHSH
jgi:hypothetical protein